MRKLLPALLAVLLLMFSGLHGFAQDRNCASHEVFEQMLKADPQFVINQQRIEELTLEFIKRGGASKGLQTLATGIINIPVVFHVLYNTSDQNISDSRIQAQLKVLNDDFQALNADKAQTPSVYQSRIADVQVQFCFAQRDPSGNATDGIIRKSTKTRTFSSNNAMKFSSQGGDDAWPRDSYLNIWVCNLGTRLLGYAQFPGGSAATDGVVVDFKTVGGPGDASPEYGTTYGIGRTATHEVGHWFNLRHIWGDGNCATDFVDDTPFHPASNGGCPSASLTTTCSQNPGALMMWMNYMDYTYDRCMYMFTNGQKDRMRALFEPGGARVALLASQGCVAPNGGGTCAVPGSLTTTNIAQTSATLSWASVSGANTYDVQWRAAGAGSFTSVAGLTGTSYNLVGLTAGADYEWQVRANCSSSSSAYSALQAFTTQAVTGGCNDVYEPNDNSGTATVLTIPTTIVAGIGSAGDEDYYRISTSRTSPNLQVVLSNLPADYDMQLLDNRGRVVVSALSGDPNSETLVYNGSKQGNFYLRVFGKSGAFDADNCYTLAAETSSTNYRSGNVDASRLYVAAQTVRLFPNPAQTEFTIVFGSDWSGAADVTLTDFMGRQVLNRTVQATGVSRVSVANMLSGVYMVKVSNGSMMTTQKIVVAK